MEDEPVHIARSRGAAYHAVKRGLDLLHASLGLVLLSPLLLFLALAVKLTSRGPVLYRQERLGRCCRPFFLLKFRTMREGADRDGPLVTSAGDGRVTPLGRFMRRYKLDELPQLLNVVRGDMSFVGPRPQTRGYFDLYRLEYERILAEVRPGITDRATLLFRNEEAELARYADPERAYIEEFIPAKLQLHREYVRQMSLMTDMVIVLTTVWSIVPGTTPPESRLPISPATERSCASILKAG